MIEFFQNIDTLSFVVGMFTVMILDILFAFLNRMVNKAFRERAMRRDLEERFNQIDHSLEIFYKHLRAIERRFPGEGDLTDD